MITLGNNGNSESKIRKLTIHYPKLRIKYKIQQVFFNLGDPWAAIRDDATFARKYRTVPTSSRWVSEDGSSLKWTQR